MTEKEHTTSAQKHLESVWIPHSSRDNKPPEVMLREEGS